mmetsp:Transcript_100267/g.178271  ORF Transcript_100267/g.178271 Transcript_100267/m.178271 type:complete len:168 (-) Transcript_100267:81-584(-)|eukprot:CAMPEP_0197648750 /NCGR_PEP_ID=MMETSP1338-20131121/27940_1 /TAXON_ID=43686 ORGANISM="Pelagodinium beii, Strain RCC1491" /NCGR_SAMPLE_ID=MMETSP1338 /ASSEMBLY_ACC=CAM_ASM_000754 /LENGTH=167 /DNA_ID=CAMNT_0043222803 /DNA_START=63 /DNA_END=566 /DNA_ORIENTATION=-
MPRIGTGTLGLCIIPMLPLAFVSLGVVPPRMHSRPHLAFKQDLAQTKASSDHFRTPLLMASVVLGLLSISPKAAYAGAQAGQGLGPHFQSVRKGEMTFDQRKEMNLKETNLALSEKQELDRSFREGMLTLSKEERLEEYARLQEIASRAYPEFDVYDRYTNDHERFM